MKKLRIIKYSLFTLLAGIFIFFFVENFLIYRVSGISMAPTLKNNDYILVKRTKNVKSGDIIVFFSVKVGSRKKLVKRILGEGGMFVGHSKDGNYIKILKKLDKTNSGFFKIPDGFLFVVGDNYKYSKDSREGWLLNKKLVIGKVILRLFPPKIL